MTAKKVNMEVFAGVTQTRAAGAPLRFLHAADLHLGLGCGPTDSIRHSRRRAAMEAFLTLLDQAAVQQVHLVLLAGDLLEEAVLQAQDKRILRSALESCPCPVVLLPGNHDPMQSGSLYLDRAFWPESTLCLGTEWMGIVFPKLRLRLWGAGFATRRQNQSLLPAGSVSDWLSEPQSSEEDWCDIGMLHGEVTSSGVSAYNPIRPQDLARTGLDYVALGHIHKPSGLCDREHGEGLSSADGRASLQEQTCAHTCWCYPGSLIGNGFDECGPRGYYSLQWQSGKGVTATFCPSPHKEFRQLQMEAYYCEDPREAAQEVLARLAALQPDFSDHYYRIVWTGTWPCDAKWNLQELEIQLGPQFAYLQTQDHTRTEIHLDQLASERTLRGRAIRVALQDLGSGSQEEQLYKERGLRLLLEAFEGVLSEEEPI